MTIQDALVAYRTYAKAEGKSPKTISWVTSSMGYFAEFLGPRQQDTATIKGNDLRRFIIALQEKPKFSNHPYNKSQAAKLSAQSIETYCRGIKAFFAFLKREKFISTNAIAKVTTPKVPEVVIPTFSEKEVAKLLSQPNTKTNEGFRDYCAVYLSLSILYDDRVWYYRFLRPIMTRILKVNHKIIRAYAPHFVV